MYKWIIACCLLLLACKKEEEPSVLAPCISLNEVTEITRNTARISAEIELRGEGTVTRVNSCTGHPRIWRKRFNRRLKG